MACEGCSIRFTILRRKKKCEDCGLIFCSDCVISKNRLYQCYRCKVLTCEPLNMNEVTSLKLRDLQWFLDWKGIPVERNDLREKSILVQKIMDYSHQKETPNYRSIYPKIIEVGHVGGLFTADTISSTSMGTPLMQDSDQSSSNGTGEPIQRDPNPNTQDDKMESSMKEEKNRLGIQNNYQVINLDFVGSYDQIFSLSIMELKLLLTKNSISFRGCCEKSELQERVVWLWKLKEAASNKNAIPDENLCKICMEETIDALLLDCGHMLTCFQCGKRLHDCPICRQIIVRVVRAFKS